MNRKWREAALDRDCAAYRALGMLRSLHYCGRLIDDHATRAKSILDEFDAADKAMEAAEDEANAEVAAATAGTQSGHA